MKWIKRLFISSSLAGVLSQILVIAVFATVFSATIAITNTGATNYTYLPLLFTIDNNNLATQGYISSDGTDVQLYQSSTLLKRMLVDDRTLFVLPTLSAYGSASVDFTTNNTVENFSIISGYGGYVTVADDPDLEISGNGTVELTDAYIDTSNASGKTIFSHYDVTNGGIDCFVSPTVSGNITARVITINSATDNITPSAAGDYNNLNNSGGAAKATNYTYVDDPVTTPDDLTTYVYINNAAEIKDAYNMSTPVWLGDTQTITSVTVYFRCIEGAGSTGKARPSLRLSGSETAGTEIDITTTFTTYSEVLARPGGGSWSASDMDNLQMIIGLRNTTGGNSICTQIYIEVAYNYETYTDVSTSSVSSGKYDLEVSISGGTLGIYLDGVLQDSIASANIPNSTANWTILNGTTVPYCDIFEIYKGGNRELLFEPNTMIIGTTLPDREATGGVNNGTFTWGTNPASVSVEIGRLTFSSTYTSSTSITSPDVVGVIGDGIGSITRPNTDLVMPGNEFYPSVNTIATLSNIPTVMIWWFISFVFALLTLGVVRKYSNSIFAGGLMAVIIMALFCVFGTSATDPNTGGCLEWWQPAVVLIAVITQMVTDRTYSM